VPESPDDRSGDGPAAGGDVEITLVTMVFDTAGSEEAEGRMLGVLANYVVVSRQQPGCRNIDLCHSVTTPGRYVVIEKWASPQAQRAHFDSPEMVEMARACQGLLAGKPEIDLLEGLSAHDLR
jgi:quinol monooxygenase YgiN